MRYTTRSRSVRPPARAWLALALAPACGAAAGSAARAQDANADAAGPSAYDRIFQALSRATNIAAPAGDGDADRPGRAPTRSDGVRPDGAVMALWEEFCKTYFAELPHFDGVSRWNKGEDGSLRISMGNYGAVTLKPYSPQTGEVMGTVRISARNLLMRVAIEPHFGMEIYAEGDVKFFTDTPGLKANFTCERITFAVPSFQGLATKARMRTLREAVNVPVKSFLDDSPRDLVGSGDPFRVEEETTDSSVREAYATAEEVRIIGANHMEVVDAVVTGDGFAKPHWGVHMKAGLYRPDEKMEAYHATVRVGGVPVFYIPYFLRDLKYNWPWMSVEAGNSGRWGIYQRTQVAFDLPERENRPFNVTRLGTRFETYSDRGWGLGLSAKYKPGRHPESEGSLSFYDMKESWIAGREDRKRGEDRNQFTHYRDMPGIRHPWKPHLYEDDHRIIVQWDHYQKFGDLWDFRAEARYYRDADVGLDYDRANYVAGKTPMASFSLRRQTDLWQVEMVAQKRVNTWVTQNEYLPELRWTLPGVQVGELPLYLDHEMRVGLVNRRYGKDAARYEPDFHGSIAANDVYGRPPFADPGFHIRDGSSYGHFFRALGDTRVSAPLKAGFLAFTPWVGARYGFYGDTYGAAEIDSSSGVDRYASKAGASEGDYLLMAGATLNTTVYNTFGTDGRWRLMFQPKVDFTVTNEPHLDPAVRYPLDAFDDYGREALLRYGLHTKLQRRDAAGQIRDVLDLGAHIAHYPRRDDRLDRNHNREATELDLDGVWRPTRRLAFWASALYDTEYSRFNRILGGVDWRFRDAFRVYAAHARYAGRPEDPTPYAARVDESTFGVRSQLWDANSRYSGEFAITHNWGDDSADTRHGINEYRVAIYRNLWDNFDLGLNYTVNYRRRDARDRLDRSVNLTLTPMGFMGYRRPAADVSATASKLVSESRYARQPDPRSYAGNHPVLADADPGAADVDRGALLPPEWLDGDARFLEGMGGYAGPGGYRFD